ncbi:hypothetical protein CHGG_05834 [Chaetomium globosum CBS 148.51]|uniref:Amino acid transporter transmembrane domain-containing protein n=1 Tax=Chaetomium globosum (strain ATCC 6205 / CBS 148.51 / DSM 1962 / NBRC 6347 / NRRL 1970) TaxID=306901 RepID=Q2H681_CHAGB|nr:uncharacterized protein CHGG_05834 [Chaetomium globosum CBS 148.51]EAQ89215.1 hypothetical protein CHGG_05834 [Chaetomium globosum CBS 148.51]
MPRGGHGVFPNIYRDMRHPHKYNQALKISFSFTYLLDATTAIAGLLMFGDDVRDAITSNILREASYPRALAGPHQAVAGPPEGFEGDGSGGDGGGGGGGFVHGLVGRGMGFRGVMKVVIRVGVVVVFLGISIAFPAFDSIMAFMGSALCFTICVTYGIVETTKFANQPTQAPPRLLPQALQPRNLNPRKKPSPSPSWILSFILSIIGTVWAFLPKSLIGAEPAAPELR